MTTKTLAKEFEVKLRVATSDDYRIWARGSMQIRINYNADYVMELNADEKIYILFRTRATSFHLEAVCDKPSFKLLERMGLVIDKKKKTWPAAGEPSGSLRKDDWS